MCVRPVEDSKLHTLMVVHRLALHLPKSLENRLGRCRQRDRAPTPRVRIAVQVCDIARGARQAPWQPLHVAGIIEDRLERTSLLDAGALELGESL